MEREAEGTVRQVELWVNRRLRDAGFDPVEIPEELATRTARSGTVLTATELRDAAGATARMARVTSNRAQIINVLGVPGDWRRSPLFEAELVFFQQTARVLYLDLPLLPGAVADRAQLLQLLPEVPRELFTDPEGLSEFIDRKSAFQPIFHKNAEPAELEIFAAILPNYLETWVELCQICRKKRVSGPSDPSGSAEPEPPEPAANLADFLEHHLTQTPGRLFLSRIFGEQWADDFLRGFMYKYP